MTRPASKLNGANCLLVNLRKIKRAVSRAYPCQFVAVTATRAEKVDSEVVDIRLAVGEFQVDCAALAGPHSHLLKVGEVIVA